MRLVRKLDLRRGEGACVCMYEYVCTSMYV